MNTPAYDTYTRSRLSNDRISVKVVHSPTDLFKVLAVRASTFVGEQHCPYGEEFDGNDYCAVHFLGLIDDEPGGCLRARFFADFVKLEHLAVRQEFRSTPVVFRLARAGIDFARKKGYRTIYGHANEFAEKIWKRFGAVRIEKQREIAFSGYQYAELRIDVEPDPEPITLDSDPYVIDRPEGQWHRRGILEQSGGSLLDLRRRRGK